MERSAAPPPLLGKFMDQQMGRQTSQEMQKKTNVPQVTAGEMRISSASLFVYICVV